MTELKVNLQGSWKRILAMITVVAMCFTVIYVSPVSAASKDSLESVRYVSDTSAQRAEVVLTDNAIEVSATTAAKAKLTVVSTDEVSTDEAVAEKMEWSVDGNAATVDQNGTVKGVSPGEATIVVTFSNKGNVVTAGESITVTEGPAPRPPVTTPVESVAVTPKTLSLEVGKTGDLTAEVSPADAADKTVAWSTSDSTKVTVDPATGKVTAVAVGIATITATAGGKSDTCEVTVTGSAGEGTVAVTGVTLSKTSASLFPTQTTTLTATVAPDNATNKAVTWKSDNEAVAKVVNGKITAVKKGTAKITATAGEKTATCTVTVKNPTVKLNATKLTMKWNTTTKALKATSSWSGDAVKSATSNKKGVVAASSKGNVITLKAKKKNGTAKITVTMKSGVKKTCTVTVKKNAKIVTTKLTIKPTGKKVTKVKRGGSLKLEVVRKPINAKEKITWSTNNKKIATVSQTGKVKIKKNAKVGKKVTITAKTTNGNKKVKKATYKITVTK